MSVYILGLNAYHGDSSACLFEDGRLIAAVEEERFRRIKHWAGFPVESIRYCLEAAGIGMARVAHVAVNRDPRANLWRKAWFALAHAPSFALIRERLSNARAWGGIGETIAAEFPGEFSGTVHHIEHHLAHLASAYLVSPFDRAAAVSIDGSGDFSTAAWALGEGNRLGPVERVPYPHSLGVFYQAMTQYLGFPHYGDEYKVMGLRAYGEPEFLDLMREMVRITDSGFELDLRFFRHHTDKLNFEWKGGSPVFGPLYSDELTRRLGAPRKPEEPVTERHKNLAASVQVRFEEVYFALLNRLAARWRVDRIALSGGCAFNSLANGRLYGHTPFEKVYVQAAAGDAGGAIGAAAVVANRIAPNSPRYIMKSASWGPAYSGATIRAAVDEVGDTLSAGDCDVETYASDDELCAAVAEDIAGGAVVGWFQGRLEWGPRALGNRSILCDPRRGDMKDILNLKIKRRESFRPFAPSVLREAAPAWFETDDDVPFMMQVFTIRPERRAAIPAVTHVDGTGRLQTVSEETNPLYDRLIRAFDRLTGVPMVLNTSFNENEPIVCRPKEAIDCFLRTRMDVLALERTVIRRRAEGLANRTAAAGAERGDRGGTRIGSLDQTQ